MGSRHHLRTDRRLCSGSFRRCFQYAAGSVQRSCLFHSGKHGSDSFQLDFSQLATFNFVVVLLAFLFVDLFDTIGTLIGVSSKANMLDKNGKLPHIKGALMADAVATAGGALLGVSTTTTYVESAAGVSEGGRTGLTAVTVSILFLLSLFFSPFFMAIPAFATAPALVSVGFLMFTAVTGIDFDDPTEAFPCYLTIIAMPFTYSIAEGIAFGIISYTLINLLAGNRSKVSLLMIILTVLCHEVYFYLIRHFCHSRRGCDGMTAHFVTAPFQEVILAYALMFFAIGMELTGTTLQVFAGVHEASADDRLPRFLLHLFLLIFPRAE